MDSFKMISGKISKLLTILKIALNSSQFFKEIVEEHESLIKKVNLIVLDLNLIASWTNEMSEPILGLP